MSVLLLYSLTRRALGSKVTDNARVRG